MVRMKDTVEIEKYQPPCHVSSRGCDLCFSTRSNHAVLEVVQFFQGRAALKKFVTPHRFRLPDNPPLSLWLTCDGGFNACLLKVFGDLLCSGFPHDRLLVRQSMMVQRDR